MSDPIQANISGVGANFQPLNFMLKTRLQFTFTISLLLLVYESGGRVVWQLAPLPHSKMVLGLNPPGSWNIFVWRLQFLFSMHGVSLSVILN